MQASDEHTKAYQNGVNDRSKRRNAGPSRASVPSYQMHERKDGLLPLGAQDLEERVRSLQEEDTPLGCKCRNSRCLKLYCVCFAARRFCEGCACIDCGNTEENVAEVHKRRHKVNVKNPHAFQDKKNPIVAKGCNCLKSRCLKGYCECYAAARGCMPICCCKDCENVYGVRPGIDDQMLGHRRMPLFNYGGAAAESEEEGTEPPGRVPPRKWPEFDMHPLAHVANTSHALNAAQVVRAGRPVASDSSEPPHQDLLNLVAAAEQLERDTGLEIPCSDKHQASRRQPGPKKQLIDLHAMTAEVIAAQSGQLSQPLFKSAGHAAKRSGPAARHSKAGPWEQDGRGVGAAASLHAAPHGEQSAIRTMHAKLLHHRPHASKSQPENAHVDGSPLDENALFSPVQAGKGGATPHHVKLVRSPEGLHLTIVSAPTSGDRSSDVAAMDESNPGGSSEGAGIMSHAVTGRLSVTATNVQTLQTTEVPSEGAAAECPARDGPEDEELGGMLSFPSAQENSAFGAAQVATLSARETIAAIGTQGGADLDSKAVQDTAPVEPETNGAPAGVQEQAENSELKVERRSPIPQATTAVDDIAQSKMKALLVTTLPDKGSDDGGLYCSIPVALPPEDGAANAPLHTMLLVPCSKVPAGARKGQQQVRVQLQSVDLATHDLELLCKSADAANEGGAPQHSAERTHSGMENLKRNRLDVSALKTLRAGDNSSQHSGDVSPWGPGNPTIAPDEPGCLQQNPRQPQAIVGAAADGPDDTQSKDMDCQHAADKDERRFRSARLQKRAAREGPRLTQVEFDDTVLASSKRRRMAPDPSIPATARPDVLCGIIGKRVVVPRRSRTAVPSSQALSAAMPPPGTQSTQERERNAQPQQPANSHCPNVRTKSTAVCAGAPSPAQVDEERHAVMGLLSLCKAS